MHGLSFDEALIVKRLGSLPRPAWIAFAVACTERLLPNYRAFQQRAHWGDAQALEDGLQLAWSRIRGAQVLSQEVAEIHERVEAAEPETEDFVGPYVSPALDAAAAVGLVLELLTGATVEAAAQVASLSIDTVDMYVDTAMDLVPSDPRREEAIRVHPLMQQELRRQAEDLELIERWCGGGLDAKELHQHLATNVSNLELAS